MMLKEPFLVEYFDTSYETYEQKYLLRKEQGKVYLCSVLCYKLAQKINKVDELPKVDSFSLPIEWCSYKQVNNNGKEFSLEINYSVIKENFDEVISLIEENFEHISRISDFLEEFNDYSANRDFDRACGIANAITSRYLPETLIQKLFNIVFKHFEKQFESEKLKLIMNPYYGKYVANTSA